MSIESFKLIFCEKKILQRIISKPPSDSYFRPTDAQNLILKRTQSLLRGYIFLFLQNFTQNLNPEQRLVISEELSAINPFLELQEFLPRSLESAKGILGSGWQKMMLDELLKSAQALKLLFSEEQWKEMIGELWHTRIRYMDTRPLFDQWISALGFVPPTETVDFYQSPAATLDQKEFQDLLLSPTYKNKMPADQAIMVERFIQQRYPDTKIFCGEGRKSIINLLVVCVIQKELSALSQCFKSFLRTNWGQVKYEFFKTLFELIYMSRIIIPIDQGIMDELLGRWVETCPENTNLWTNEFQCGTFDIFKLLCDDFSKECALDFVYRIHLRIQASLPNQQNFIRHIMHSNEPKFLQFLLDERICVIEKDQYNGYMQNAKSLLKQDIVDFLESLKIEK